jgi:hypothetical protein
LLRKFFANLPMLAKHVSISKFLRLLDCYTCTNTHLR